jgi:hypothetical protein
MRCAYAGFAGGLHVDHPRVEIVVGEARSYIRRTGEKFSVIQATLVDTWVASSSGAFTLSENNLYTVEAFGEFLAHLREDGVLIITRWYDPQAPKEFVRLVAVGPWEMALWAWAINGATSVLGSIAAIFLSMNFGFTASLLTGLAVYALAAAAIPPAPCP